MPRKVFTAGEVLAAADVNEFLQDQAVMSFAGTAARGSAIGTAVEGMVSYLEDIDSLSVNNGTDWTIDRTIQVFAGTAARGSAIPSPVEGMYAHLNDTDTLQYYDGSAWANAGASPGMTLINTTSFSAVASQNVEDVFSSTYDSYKVIFNLTATGNTGLRIQMSTGGTAATGSNYARQYALAVNASLFAGKLTSQTSYDLTDVFNKGTGEITVFNPNKAEPTSFSALSGYNIAGNDLYWFSSVGNHQLSTAYTGFTIFPGTGTITGQLSVYGLAK
jgi:hypothetical protein